MTDREIEYEVRIAACEPSRFSDIADRFYTNTRWDVNDKEMWRRFWAACNRILEDAGEDGPFTMLIAPPVFAPAPLAEGGTQ